MNSLLEKITTCFDEYGMKLRTVDIRHISALKDEILHMHKAGMFDEKFFEENLNWINSNPKCSIPDPKTVIIAAAPQGMTKTYFDYSGKTVEVTIPPTYIYNDMLKTCDKLLKESLGAFGFSVERVTIPLKALAARSGLGQYGRNNICYVPGMGSFMRLAAFCTDWECEVDNWQEPANMKECEDCGACMENCFTGAIKPDRFMIHGEYCLTTMNENKDDFPEWVDKSWHNSLVGCMACQLCCPENKDWIKIENGPHFDEQETELILKGTPEHELPEKIKAKLQELCITDYYSVLHRNLKVLVERDA